MRQQVVKRQVVRQTSVDVFLVDFGSQLTGLIARFLMERDIPFLHCSLKDALLEIKKPNHVKAMILSGGPESVTKHPSHIKDVATLLAYRLPTLGICYGQQVMCQALGGEVFWSGKQEFGRASMHIKKHPFWKGIETEASPISQKITVWMSHADHIKTLPPGFETIGWTNHALYAAIAHTKHAFYGFQFHPEASHTSKGKIMLETFLHDVAGLACSRNTIFDPEKWIKQTVHALKKQWHSRGKILCAFSGGTDSAVAVALVCRALGVERVECLFIDTGLMRYGEGEEVAGHARTFLGKHVHNFHIMDASALFFKRLKGVRAPEKKRKIIGKTFIDCLEKESQKYTDITILLQGTIASDVAESATEIRGQKVIKSHHNVGGLPGEIPFALMEPLRTLFKDQVRLVGKFLEVPDFFLKRHPFPGPGLAIRIPGTVTKSKVAMLQKADAIFLEELKKSSHQKKVWQGFAVLLPVRSVGVMGDQRTFGYTCALRAVSSVDAMTAECSALPISFLSLVATRIVNEVQGINRIVYDITSKPPACIEWE